MRRRSRVATRAYRRSLPAMYRWRRILLAATIPILAGILIFVGGPDPRGWILDRWHDLRGTTTAVPITTVTVEPDSPAGADSRPGNLTDGTEAAWTTPWRAGSAAGDCHTEPGGTRISITFEPRRIRNLIIYAGQPAARQDRLQEFRPRTISYSYDGGQCRTATLKASGDRETVPAESENPVSALELVITGTYDPPANGRLNSLTVTELGLEARP